ncbi:hypothetical protein Tco_0961609 [Tanacetum coccineum]
MGLDDSYMQIRSIILFREPLLDVKNAYVIISNEESHKIVISGSNFGTSQRSQKSAFSANVLNRGDFQRSQTSANVPRTPTVTGPNDIWNRRTVVGPVLVCENCGFNGHTVATLIDVSS